MDRGVLARGLPRAPVEADMSIFSFPRGVLVGAVLSHYFDPQRGRARRARLRDAAFHLRRETRGLLEASLRDAQHRSRGLVQRFRGPARGIGDERVIVERVRSALGHVISHPSAIDVFMRDGKIVLRGPLFTHEAETALRCARRVDGVTEVIDELERHEVADIPSLQGEARHPDPNLWTPAARGAALVGGSSVALFGMLRGGVLGALYTTLGSAVAARGAMNLPIRRIVGMLTGREELELHKTIRVHAPIERVFDLCRHIENFPRFMEHVREIEISPNDPARSRWTVDGPAGSALSFEARTTILDEPREIAWTTLPDQPIHHAGVVRFEKVPEGTRIDLHMTYRPPAGAIGVAVGKLLGWSPKDRIDDDLVRLKSLLEEGRTRAHGEKVSEADLIH